MADELVAAACKATTVCKCAGFASHVFEKLPQHPDMKDGIFSEGQDDLLVSNLNSD